MSFRVSEIESKCGNGGEPNLTTSPSGKTILTWIQYLNDSTDALMVSSFGKNQWKTPIKISEGSNWFSNWADFPTLASFGSHNMNYAAHWLEKSAQGTYDYDIKYSISDNRLSNWTKGALLNLDGIPAEHGFVTMKPYGWDQIFATWLDGRNTKKKQPMTLRGTFLNADGTRTDEVELDDRVCDCCQTTALVTPQGILVAYRDRSEGEIRDISYTLYRDGSWTAPRSVHSDNWVMKGCPVNGPSVDGMGRQIWLAWHTGANDKPRIQLSTSQSEGDSFSAPIVLSDMQVLGRIDVTALSESRAFVSWMESNYEQAEIHGAIVDEFGKVLHQQVLGYAEDNRSSGFPVSTIGEDGIIMAWTVGKESTSIKTVRVEVPDQWHSKNK